VSLAFLQAERSVTLIQRGRLASALVRIVKLDQTGTSLDMSHEKVPSTLEIEAWLIALLIVALYANAIWGLMR
jgi:hypothetical protein